MLIPFKHANVTCAKSLVRTGSEYHMLEPEQTLRNVFLISLILELNHIDVYLTSERRA